VSKPILTRADDTGLGLALPPVTIIGLRTTRTCVLAAAAALALSGCLGGDERSTRIEGDTAVVYSSLPRAGVSGAAARATAAGQRLALEDAGGRAGGLRVELVELHSSEPDERLWDPDQVSANAERAADDPRAIAYLGELDFGGSAVSLPITNDAGLLQVSPGDGLTSLTRTPLGRPRAGPDRYYPAEERSFARLVPADELQAEVLLTQVRRDGARRIAVLFDGDIHSRELGAVVLALARRDGPEPVTAEEYRGRVEEIPDVVRGLAEERPDAVVYAGIVSDGTAGLLAAIDGAMPGVPVRSTSGMLARDPAVPIPAAPASVSALGPIPPATELPPAGQRLLARLRRGEGAAVALPEAVYGYESMRLVLDAIRAGGADRARVMREALRIRERRSPLGTYRIRATGEVEGSRFALHELRGGSFEFVRMVD
jgi:branched-chain amino acid transport system substrate-binding protein